MRAFNEREKEIIKLVSKGDIESQDTFQKVLQENYYTKERGVILILNHIRKDVLLFLPVDDYADKKKHAKAIGEFWELNTLVSYLIDSRYLSRLVVPSKSLIDFIYDGFSSGIDSNSNEISFIDENGEKCLIFPDKICNSKGDIIFKSISLQEIYEPVKNNLFGVVYPTETIKNFVKKGFRTEEDIKYKNQSYLSWIAMIIAFLTSLVSINLSINSSNESSALTKEQTEIIENFKVKQIQNNDLLLEKIENLSTGIKNAKSDSNIIFKLEENNNQNREIIDRIGKLTPKK